MVVTDTHALVWYSTRKFSKITPRVKRLFEEADDGRMAIYVPTCVLLEAAMLEHDGTVRFDDGFERWAQQLMDKPCFLQTEMTISIVARAMGFSFNGDPFDKVMVATAVELDLPLITKDVAITESNLVEVCW